MIKSFADRQTLAVFEGKAVKALHPDIANAARKKLRMLEVAKSLFDLKAPPSNRLEMLKGNRAGQYSIRINDQWRVCFRWQDGDAYDAEITDYH